MEKFWGPGRGGPAGTTGSSRSKGPDQATRTIERPARLADGDLVEAVSLVFYSNTVTSFIARTYVNFLD